MIVRSSATFGVKEMRSEDRVDQCRFSQTSLAFSSLISRYSVGGLRAGKDCRFVLTNADDVELEATLQELALNLRGDAVETDMALREDGVLGHGHFDEVGGERVRGESR